MTLPWFLFYGRTLGMSKREILITPYGEMMDMIACSAIYNGNADEKVKLSFEEALKVE